MGGGGTPAPQVVGGDPIPVPRFGGITQMPAPSGVQPPASVKGGTLSGLPSLDIMFNAPLGGPSPFPNTASFPKPGMPTPSALPPAYDVSRPRLLPLPEKVPLRNELGNRGATFPREVEGPTRD